MTPAIEAGALLALADRISKPLWEIIAHEGWYGVAKLKADAREALGQHRGSAGGSFAELAAALRARATTEETPNAE